MLRWASLVKAEERFETIARDALHHVLEAGRAAADGDAHTVDLDEERGLCGVVAAVAHGRRVLAGGRERSDPAERGLADAFVGFVDEWLAEQGGLGGIDLDAAEIAFGVEQRELVGDLADAEAGVELIGGVVISAAGAPDAEGCGEVVELGRAVAVGPPQTRVGDVELGCVGGCECHVCAAGRHGDFARDVNAFERDIERAVHGGCGVVGERDAKREGRARGVGQRKGGDDLRGIERDRALSGDRDVLPDTHVAVADARHPVPAFGGGEGGAVDGLEAAVVAGTGGDGLLLRDPGVVGRIDEYGERVLAGFQEPSDIEAAADESAVNAAELVAVEPDLRAVIDAVERERRVPVQGVRGRGEVGAVPEALVRE